MKSVSQKWQFWSRGNREREHGQLGWRTADGGKPFPAGKSAAGHRTTWGLPAWTTEHSKPCWAKKGMFTGMKCLKCFTCANASSSHRELSWTARRSSGSKEGWQPGQGDKETGWPDSGKYLWTSELSAVLGVLLIAWSYHSLFEAFHPHSLFATYRSLVMLAHKGRRLLAEKKLRSLFCST